MLQRIKCWNNYTELVDKDKVDSDDKPHHVVVCKITTDGLKIELDTTDFKYEKELITVNDDAVWHTVIELDFPVDINNNYYFIYIVNNKIDFMKFIEHMNKHWNDDRERPWFAPAGLTRGLLDLHESITLSADEARYLAQKG